MLHWATQSEPAGEWKQPPQGWVSVPANSWGTGGASWETEMEPVLGAPGWSACTIEAPVGEDGVVFVIRTADKSHWVKDDGQDFMVYSDEARSNADVRALVKRRKEEARRREKERQRKSKSRKKSSGGGGFVFVPEKVPRSQPWWCARLERRRHSHVAGCHRLGGGVARCRGRLRR